MQQENATTNNKRPQTTTARTAKQDEEDKTRPYKTMTRSRKEKAAIRQDLSKTETKAITAKAQNKLQNKQIRDSTNQTLLKPPALTRLSRLSPRLFVCLREKCASVWPDCLPGLAVLESLDDTVQEVTGVEKSLGGTIQDVTKDETSL